MKRSMTAGRRVAALTSFLFFAQTGAAETTADKERAYWALAAQYAKGDRRAAVSGIRDWTEADLGPILRSVENLGKAARRCEACDERARFDELPLRAAMLLHAERDRLDRAARIQTSGGGTECAVGANGRMSAELLRPVAQQPGGLPFAARFAAAFSLHLRSAQCALTGRNWAEAGLKVAPRDALLRFVDGLASETIGMTGFVEPTQRGALDERGRWISGYGDVNREKELNRAVTNFEEALVLNPQLSEARLRLGRVLWRLGRSKEARESLGQSVAEKDGALRYLAHLFLGRCLEDDSDLAGAIEHYAAAVALRPDTQISAVALAHAQSLRGRPERAREILESVLSRSGGRQTVHPYWNYLMGAPTTAESLIEGLRAEITK